MATEKCAEGGVVHASVDARLDAIDRLLLGFIPRHERMAIVRDLELRLHSVLAHSPHETAACATGGAALLADSALGVNSSACAGVTLGWESAVSSANRRPLAPVARRSILAVAAAILGIVACVLLMGMPIAYFAMNIVGELLDETGMLLTLSTYMLAMLLGGGGAIFLGTAALWKLRHQSPAVRGRGWAIAGLCAGPLPFAVASLLVLCWGLPMLGEMGFFGQPVFAITAAPESVAASNTSAEVRQVSDSQPTCASPAKPTPPSATLVIAEGCSELQACPASCSASQKSATPAPTAAKVGIGTSPTNPEDRPAPVPNPESASTSATESPESE